MNCVRAGQSKRNPVAATAILSLLLWIVLLVLLSCGCITKTVAPKPVEDTTASFSETGLPDSGMLFWVTNEVGITYLVATPSYRLRYNAMIEKFSTNLFLPPIQRDHGVNDYDGTNYMITLDAVAKFNKMNRYRKQMP